LVSTNRRRASALLDGVGDDAAYIVSRIAEQIPGRAIMEEDSRSRGGTRSSVAKDVSVRGWGSMKDPILF
jgi:hypothetical protein